MQKMQKMQQTTRVTKVILSPVAKFDEKKFEEGCELVLRMIARSERLEARKEVASQ